MSKDGFIKCVAAALAWGSLSCSAGPALALDPNKAITQVNQTVYQKVHGLPVNGIRSIVQTRDGYIWLGTGEGLVRFDGVRFTVFNKRNIAGLEHNSIETLFEGRDGSLWIGAGGITRYKDGEFTTYTAKDGLSKNSVRSIYETRDGSLWIGTFNGGLNRFKDGEFVTYSEDDGLPDNFVSHIVEDRSGNLWLSTRKGLTNFKDGRFVTYTTKDGLPTNHVSVVYEEADGNLWVGTYGGGLCQFKGGSFITFKADDGLPANTVTSILTDRANNLWVGTEGGGLARFRDGRFIPYRRREAAPIKFVNALCEDFEGNLWVGTDEGLVRLCDGKFITYGTEEGLSDDFVWSLAEGQDGALWLGTGNGLNRLKDEKVTTYTTGDGLSSNKVYSVSESRDGSLWVGTADGGLNRLRGGRVSVYKASDLSGVGSILEDREGSLWVGTLGDGLRRFKNGAFTAYTTEQGLPSNTVFSVSEGPDGSLWVGTGSGGLSHFKDGRFTNYTTKDGLSNDNVTSIHIDKEGALWVGTLDGLNKFEGGKFTVFTTARGLFDDTVWRILEDDRGHLWMTCNKGVFRVAKRELNDLAAGKLRHLSYVSYGVADGMRSDEVNYSGNSSGLKMRDGRLWFPTIKGAAAINPNHIRKNRLPPPVYIEGALFGKRAIDPRGGAVLPPGHGELEVRYTALSFVRPEAVTFKYKLEGFDDEWFDAGARRTAYYTNLPPGRYRFRVLACNDDGVWNETGAAFEFYLQPYFYQTAWFYALCALGAVLAGWSLYRLRVKRLKQRAEFLESKITERTSELEKATRAKSEFLANVSHEIRTPMNAVVAITRLLSESDLTDEQSDFVETLRFSSDSLLNIINDILDFSKIESGKLGLEEKPFEVSECIEEALEICAIKIAGGGPEIVYELDPAVPQVIVGDRMRLRQVLMNLVGNAIKFTPAGEVSLAVHAGRQFEGGSRELHFVVRDTGVGIPPERMESLFQPFCQGDSSTTRRYGGTGLGLTISKRLCQLMGGDIWAESEPGKGSSFHFTILAGPPAAAPPPRPGGEEHLLKDRRLLIVADNETLLRALARRAQSWGMAVHTAPSAEAAAALLRTGQGFDAALVDAQTLRADGDRLADGLRRLEGAARLPLILLGSAVDKRIDGAAAVSACLSKPVRSARLRRALCRVVRGGPYRVRRSAAGGVPGRRVALKILVVDDNAVNLQVALKILGLMGYSPEGAAGGLEALAAVERENYDIILTDVHMPDMDGLDLARRIRGRGPAGQSVRIIAMTAGVLPGDREACLSAGMDDFISKPVRLEELRDLLARWGGGVVLADAPAAGFHERPAADGAPEARPPRDHVDFSRILELREMQGTGGGDIVSEMIGLFVRDTPLRLAALRRALAARDMSALEREAHALRGSCSDLGAPGMSELSADLERRAREGGRGCGTLLKQLEAEYQRVTYALGSIEGAGGGGRNPMRQA